LIQDRGNGECEPRGEFCSERVRVVRHGGECESIVLGLVCQGYAVGADPQGAGTASGQFGRVLRGGYWNDVALSVRSAYRDYGSPSNGINGIAFRLARGRL
jgi:hypothetical protein